MSVLDFHNHLMPAVDDGARTVEDSCAGLTAMEADGVTAVITTPHLDGSLTLDADELEERLEDLEIGWSELKAHADEHHAGIRLDRGAEIMLDVPDPDVSDPRVRLAGGPFVLFEFSYMTVPPRSADVLAALRARNFLPILAHPERYHGFAPDFSLALEWKRSGALLQVNGGSLLGRYGPDARRFAYGLLERGLVDYVCSDFHSRGAPMVQSYRDALKEAGSLEHVQLLTEVNPRRILEGQEPLPVPPLPQKKTLWGRVSGLFPLV